jgi:alpha-mannosidase
MFDSNYYINGIKGDVPSVSFNSFLPSEKNPYPDFSITDFIVNGPYVLKTDGTFETEYLYERNKVLDEDYLKDEGGEHALIPYIGLSHNNNYLGDKTLPWTVGKRKWNTLRFDKEGYDACNEAIFLTEQRNCAYYAAFYVDCETDCEAVICYETSGSLLFLNGELIDNKPYGRVKGLWGFANTVFARFHEGRNLLMLKVRAGYICDTIDISVSNFTIYPVLAKSGELGICYPTKTKAYFGTEDTPRQVLPTFICGKEKTRGTVTIKCGDYSEEIAVTIKEKNGVEIIRPSLPALESGAFNFSLTVKSGSFSVSVFDGAIELDKFDGFCGTEHIYSDFHFDTTYHQEQRTYAMGAIDILSKMLSKLRSNPDFKAILSEVDYLHPYYSIYAKDRKTLKDAFKSGRAEADCFYNQPNEMTSSPEGLVRNLVYGQLYHRDVLGRKAYVYGPGDVFGHPNQLSQICSKGGCDGIYWGKYIFGLDTIFHHMSPDGTTLVHARGGTSREDALRLNVNHAHDSSRSGGFTPYPREDNTKWMKDTLNSAQFSVMSDFLGGINCDVKNHKKQNGQSPLCTTSRDISLYHAGVALTRQDLKRANRLCENLLITAEKFAAVAAYFGAVYPEEALDKAWRQLLCGQHHDSITGTNNEISFADLLIEYRESAVLASDIIDNSLNFLMSAISTFGDCPVIVFNPHAYDRRDICEINLTLNPDKAYVMKDIKGKKYPVNISENADKDGKTKVTFTPDAPAFGYKVYCLTEVEKVNSIKKSNENIIENEFYRITVDENKGGGIVSIYDKKEKREIINDKDGKIGAVYALKELRERMETQHEFYTTGEKLSSAESRADIRRIKDDVSDKLIIKSNMNILCVLVQELTLTKGVKRIDFRISIEDYTGDDHLFTYNLPVNIKGGKAIFDDRFAPAVRPKSRNVLDFKTHQYAMASHCSVFAANHWFGLGPSVTIEFKEKGSINIGSSALIASDDKVLEKSVLDFLAMLTKKAIPITAYPDKERTPHATLLSHFNEDLHFTDTRFVLCISGIYNEYEEKLLSDVKIRKRFEEAVNKNGAAVFYTVDSDNLWNKPIDVVLIKAKDEKTLQSFINDTDNTLSSSSNICFLHFTIGEKIEYADDYTVSILNRGNLASSVEADNSLNLMLFHTALFYGNSGKVTGNKELVPEQKSHIFEFALYPHKGSYREGNEFINALFYNDPLLSKKAEKSEKAFLPFEKSFVKCSFSFVLTSFKAGGYPLASLKGKMPPITERGFALRGFEQNGVNTKLNIKFGFDTIHIHSCDLLEENTKVQKHSKSVFTSPVTSHSIENFVLFPKKPLETLESAVLGAESETVKPTYIRSFEHSLGSMPFSYLRTAAVIDRKLEYTSKTSFNATISVVNNRTDECITGKLRLTLPKGFSADKENFEYSLSPDDYMLFPVTITKENENSKGIIYLYFDDGENEFFDALEVGSFNPSLSMKIDGSKIIVTIRNDTYIPLFGELLLACPIECWGIGDKRTDALCGITPFSHKVSLEPKTHCDYSFDITNENSSIFNAYWAAAKLVINGKVFYAYAKNHGIRRNLWAHEFDPSGVGERNGQKRYLTLKDGMIID